MITLKNTLLVAIVAALATLASCNILTRDLSNLKPFPPEKMEQVETEQGEIPAARSAIINAAEALGVVALILLVLSSISFILSFAVRAIPTLTSLVCVGASLLLFGVQYWVLKYGVFISELTFWLAMAAIIVASITVAYPWVMTMYRVQQMKQAAYLRRAAEEHASKGEIQEAETDLAAATAVEIAAMPEYYKKPGSKRNALEKWRDSVLKRVTPKETDE